MILGNIIECPNCQKLISWEGDVTENWINEFVSCNNCDKIIEIEGYTCLIIDCAKVVEEI